MLEWIRGVRINARTGLLIIALALAVWAIVVYVNLRDFVPDELSQPTGAQR